VCTSGFDNIIKIAQYGGDFNAQIRKVWLADGCPRRRLPRLGYYRRRARPPAVLPRSDAIGLES
jgi:hypothetical protein